MNIESMIVDLLKDFKDKPYTTSTALQMMKKIEEFLSSIVKFDKEHINFDISYEKDVVTINPKNLYTFITMNGIPVAYGLVENKKEWRDPITGILFEENRGNYSAYHPAPLETITVEGNIEVE